jgi:hypothetical protein
MAIHLYNITSVCRGVGDRGRGYVEDFPGIGAVSSVGALVDRLKARHLQSGGIDLRITREFVISYLIIYHKPVAWLGTERKEAKTSANL